MDKKEQVCRRMAVLKTSTWLAIQDQEDAEEIVWYPGQCCHLLPHRDSSRHDTSCFSALPASDTVVLQPQATLSPPRHCSNTAGGQGSYCPCITGLGLGQSQVDVILTSTQSWWHIWLVYCRTASEGSVQVHQHCAKLQGHIFHFNSKGYNIVLIYNLLITSWYVKQ